MTYFQKNNAIISALSLSFTEQEKNRKKMKL